MPYNPDIHHRRSIRLKGYDYSQAGAYFITIWINHRQPLLSAIADGIMYTNPAGEMVQTIWEAMPFHYQNLELDAFVIMPNHIHSIIILKSAQIEVAIAYPQSPMLKSTQHISRELLCKPLKHPRLISLHHFPSLLLAFPITSNYQTKTEPL